MPRSGNLVEDMHFSLLDRIEELVPQESLTAKKTPSMSEEYLLDHFPLFPVMPGVLMLEAMYQAAAWLIRHDDDFSHSLVLLKEAKNIKYVDFVKPGRELTVHVDLIKRDGKLSWFKGKGVVSDKTVVSGRLVLEHSNLADEQPVKVSTDRCIIRSLRKDFEILYPKAAIEVGA